QNFRGLRIEHATDLVAPLFTLTDKYSFHTFFLRILPEEEKGKFVQQLYEEGIISESKKDALGSLSAFISEEDVVKTLTNYYIRHNLYRHEVIAYFKENELGGIIASLKNYQEFIEDLKSVENQTEGAPLYYIKRAQEHLASEKGWDMVIYTTAKERDAVFLRERFNSYPIQELYQNTHVEVISRTIDEEQVEMYNFDGTVFILEKILYLVSVGAIPVRPRVLVIHTAGTGSRGYPLVANRFGFKGCNFIPRVYKGAILELNEQVFLQSHQLLDDTSKGSITCISNDQFWAISKPIRGLGRGIEVFGNYIDVTQARQELIPMGLLKESEGRLVPAIADEKELDLKLKECFRDRKAHIPHLYKVSQLGQIWTSEDHPGFIDMMIEKPKIWSEIGMILDRGYTNLNWWNHRYSLEAARIVVEVYRHILVKKLALVKELKVCVDEERRKQIAVELKLLHLDLSIDILQAVTQAALAKFLLLKTKKSKEEELVNQDYENYAYIYDLAQDLKKQLAEKENMEGLGYLDAGKQSRFIDIGEIQMLFKTYRDILVSLDKDALCALLHIDKEGKYPIIINSPKVEKAYAEGRITIEGNSIIINSGFKGGSIRNSLVMDTHCGILIAGENSISWQLRGNPGQIIAVPAEYSKTTVLKDGLLQTVTYPLNHDIKNKDPQKGILGAYCVLAQEIQEVDPSDIKALWKKLDTREDKSYLDEFFMPNLIDGLGYQSRARHYLNSYLKEEDSTIKAWMLNSFSSLRAYQNREDLLLAQNVRDSVGWILEESKRTSSSPVEHKIFDLNNRIINFKVLQDMVSEVAEAISEEIKESVGYNIPIRAFVVGSGRYLQVDEIGGKGIA
nr:hypothetical protein [Candidatus Aminicenantes bacterium]